MNGEKGNASALAKAVHPIGQRNDADLHVSAGRAADPFRMPAGSDNVAFTRLGGVLPKQHFLLQVQREKRRTDRSGAPLSIALFRLHIEGAEERSDAHELLELLRCIKRETDVLGYLGDDLIAVLLPDTDQQGVQGFTGKIMEHANSLHFIATHGMYPDSVFDELIRENRYLPDTSKFFLDHAGDPGRNGYGLKRTIDIVGALTGLLLFSPVIVITAVAIAMNSPGPIIFKQVRIGKRGVPFAFYKFRSMYVDAGDRIHREFVAKLIKGRLDEINQGDRDNPLYKLKADPRVTGVGKYYPRDVHRRDPTARERAERRHEPRRTTTPASL